MDCFEPMAKEKQKQKQTNKQWKDMRQRKQEYLTRSSSGEKR